MAAISCKTSSISTVGTAISGYIVWRTKTMAFRKSGVAPIQEIRCSCGHELHANEDACPNCKKSIIPENLKTQIEDLPTDDSESKVK